MPNVYDSLIWFKRILLVYYQMLKIKISKIVSTESSPRSHKNYMALQATFRHKSAHEVYCVQIFMAGGGFQTHNFFCIITYA